MVIANLTSVGDNFNDFTEKQLTKVIVVLTVG